MINIAKFKAELSKYLGYVRRGEEVVIMNRNESIARVVPYQEVVSPQLALVAQASEDWHKLFSLKTKILKRPAGDSLLFLLEERGER